MDAGLGNAIENVQISGGEEDIMVSNSSDPKDARFDQIIGIIEETIMDPKFQEQLNSFMDRSYSHFDNSDENKLIYTDLHREYLNIIEKFIEDELKQRITDFSMEDFMNDLANRRDEMDCEIFDILMTFEDFIEFKQLMLSHKSSKEGNSLDFGLCVQSIHIDSGKNKTPQKSEVPAASKAEAETTTTSMNNKDMQKNNNNNNNTKKSSSTPLLDNIQIDDEQSDSSSAMVI